MARTDAALKNPSFFKTLVDHEVTVELKNDIQIRGTLKSVDQYLNIKLDDIQVVEELKYPHLVRIETPLRPSIGRPPTPPGESRTPHQTTSTMSSRGSAKPLTPRPNSKSNVPTLGRQGTKKVFVAKTPSKPNASILSFFKKVDSPLKDDSIFLSQGSPAKNAPTRPKPSPDLLDDELYDIYGDDESERFNEIVGSVKRRKTTRNTKISNVSCRRETHAHHLLPTPSSRLGQKKTRRKGPFLSDSESDYEADNNLAQSGALKAEKKNLRSAFSKLLENLDEVAGIDEVEGNGIVENESITPSVESLESVNQVAWKRRKRVPIAKAQAKWEALQPRDASSSSDSSDGNSVKGKRKEIDQPSNRNGQEEPTIPTLKKEATTVDDWSKFEDIDEFPDDQDEFADGEEFIERKWMEEQARLEAAEEGLEEEFNSFEDNFVVEKPSDEGMTPACPICNASLSGITTNEATKHVNGCLDGNPVPLPTETSKAIKKESSELKYIPEGANNRFARKAAIARPGQANPFEIGSAGATPSSAFSKLMSGHAEDAAWATAAASEQSSRGKSAYQRTCPFYKIMPGFFICVDAFRYGAVQGCNAYFLSHFHSDHYVGLTSSWCHGPIYCSKVTGNLVKQQLRVDPKWVVSLDFEEKSEVPETQGVAVTMIPANHCPGSSLFLFEKVIGKGSNPRVQRVLHCGDFRACPAHVAHPLLMPELIDSISGKIKQQKIDVCYLDTTYLNPRYSFPSQEEVVRACADMCVSLKKERAEESDAWETAKRERAGSGMAKFINSASVIKAEDDSVAMEIDSSKNAKPRGRLLVVCGTYSIGKERICLGIARALDCKIWAPPGKMKICAALEDPELMSRMTDDPKEAQIHMQMLMEIRAETLQEYLNIYKPHFSRVVGFRPSGWNYKPPNSRFTESPSLSTIIHSPNWQSNYTLQDLVPQRGSTREASCFGVPYSEHSSFRELTMFVCSLRIEKVVPTVNVGSAASRAKMKAWIERWLAERRKNGCLKIGKEEGESDY
ncbi:hypothetical protein G7Y89_g4878 [Cudoniella acicularis]|uniref:Sm domain-containing protein n=1 Tax=Cudoniella acicularis TaxID=354080 RepID=A0A8H4RQS6_9HELO|nr:hypothetical protein G7Y89_g4878 [Cudoniella acicularis]